MFIPTQAKLIGKNTIQLFDPQMQESVNMRVQLEHELQQAVEEVEEELFKAFDKEVPSSEIGRLITERLRRIDQVAYVRFASVYRQFKTLEELVTEARAVIDARHYDVPGQGKLFIEAQARMKKAESNGDDAAVVATKPAARRKG